MTNDHIGGVGYEQLGPSDYVRHSCDWNAAFTWCGKPMRSLRREPDPTQTPSIKICEKCKRREAEDAAAKSGPAV